MAGGKCPLTSCQAWFTSGIAKRRHVWREGHGHVVHCSVCNEPFLSEGAREQHMNDFDHDRQKRRVKNTTSGPAISSAYNEISGAVSEVLYQRSPVINSTASSIVGRQSASMASGSQMYSDVQSALDLNLFLANEIVPDSAFLRSSDSAIDALVHFLQNNIPDDLRPARVIKGGSLGKGTAVKGKSDIDLTLVLPGYKNMRDLESNLPNILDILKSYLARYSGARVTGTTRHAVQVELTGHGNQSHSVDILPALDIDLDSVTARHGVYTAMRDGGRRLLPYYSSSLAPLQLDVIRQLPTKVKDLIRLIKYWKKNTITSSTVPTSYVMELVVIHAWQRGGSREDFNMTGALKDVLTKLVNHRDLRVEFGNLRKYPPGMSEHGNGPYIIDPANPFNNVYNRYGDTPWDWEAVAREARVWLSQPLFSGVDGTW